jgi:hypothetical protein
MSNNSGGGTAQETDVRRQHNAVDQRTVTDRITVALIPKASDDLQRLQERTGLSKTDIANRAISLYEFIESQLQAGKDLIVKDPKTGESQLVKLL